MANEHARALRKSRTPAERLLWSRLRLLKDVGYKFRQQVPIDNFIADFACLSHRLVVEVDGATHASGTGTVRDLHRDQYLREQDFRVLRFWNDDVMQHPDRVIERIVVELGTLNRFPQGGTATLDPSRQGVGSGTLRAGRGTYSS